MYKKNIALEYILTFTRNFSLVHGIWMLYLALKGFTLLQLGIVEGVFHVTSLTMEIPTGVIADVFGRKISRFLSGFLYMLFLILMLIGTDVVVVSIAFALCGLSYTLESGSGDAMLYDSLVELDRKSDYPKINGRKEVAYQAGSMISLLIGGYIANSDFELTFKITIIITIITMLVVLRMKETTVQKEKEKTSIGEKLKKQYVESFKYVFSNKRLGFLLIVGALFAFPVTTIFFYSQNYFFAQGFNTMEIGLFLALHSGTAVIGALLVERIIKKFSERMILYFIPLIEVILLWIYILDYGYIAFILLGAVESIIYVILLEYVNRLIPSSKRATILSISSMIFSILMILVFPLIGYISDVYSMQEGFIFNAIIATFAYIVFIIIYRRKHERTNQEIL